MGLRLPQANLNFSGYTDSELISRAQQVHDLMVLNVALYPTPPITMGLFQADIDDFVAKAAAAIKGSKVQTAAKATAKKNVQLDMKVLANFVNKTIQALYAGSGFTPLYKTSMKNDLLRSGFKLSNDPNPVDPISGIPAPIIRRAISDAAGTFKILVRQYTNANRNTLLYQVNYRTSAIPANPPDPAVPAGSWQTQTFTGQNEILLTGLTSGLSYDWQIAAIGGRDAKRNSNPPVNYTPIASAIII